MRNSFWMVSSIALGMTGAVGCMIVEDTKLNELRSRRDSGPPTDAPGADAPDGNAPTLFYESCRPASFDPPLEIDGPTSLEIDTRSFRSDNAMSCDVEAPGHDVFIPVRVQPGQYWHFHLAGVGTTRRPMLFLARAGSCDPRQCQFVSSSCSGVGDEHFAFQPNAAGLWYIGIDDSAEGGGQYRLDIFRPVCGDGTTNDDPEHGESCDDGNLVSGDGCDSSCRREINAPSGLERETNDNRQEAHTLSFGATTEMTVSGGIGGPGACLYPDVFSVDMPAGGDLRVDVLQNDGTPCATGSLTTDYFLALDDAVGAPIRGKETDPMTAGCVYINAQNLAEGKYFIRVQAERETASEIGYRLRIRRML